MLFVDYETRSRAPLPAVGSKVYSEDPSTEILLVGMACGPDEEPFIAERIEQWDPGTRIVSWGRFDYHIYRSIEDPSYRSDHWIDAMALARYTGMPAGAKKTGAASNSSRNTVCRKRMARSSPSKGKT